MALLRLEGIAVSYGARAVVRGVSLTAEPGELVAILGPNGAGKSTLVRAALGLVPSSGAVEIEDRPLETWRREALARTVAWVPQDVDAATGFSALELVAMGRSPHLGPWGVSSQGDMDAALAELQALGIADLAERTDVELSGGERRLVYLARAFVQSPRLLWLDEPTAFLDLRHQVLILERLRARVREGLCALAVLHDVNLAAAFADRVVLLKDGCVLFTGTPDEALEPARLAEIYGVSMNVALAANGQRLVAPSASARP